MAFVGVRNRRIETIMDSALLNTIVDVPESFPTAFLPFARVGREGWCVVCRQPIHAHMGATGKWVGCVAPVGAIPAATPFLLVPAQPEALKALSEWALAHAEDTGRPAERTIASRVQGRRVADPAPVAGPRERMRYSVERTVARQPKGLNGVQTDVLRVLASHVGKHMGCTAIAVLAGHPVETSRVALNQLWRKRAIRRAKRGI